MINQPSGVVSDATGNIYLADLTSTVRKIDPSGTITTVAGTGQSGYGGDDGPPTQAQLSSPEAVAMDAAGNLYVADNQNHRVRVVRCLAPSSFQPQTVTVILGISGSTVTLMTTPDGGFTLDGRAFAHGGTVTAANGNQYVLMLADGNWSATYVSLEVAVALGGSGAMAQT